MVTEHLKEGLSFESFAAIVDVDVHTIVSWIKNNPQFLAAVARGLPHSLLWWERLGKAIAIDDPNYQITELGCAPFVKSESHHESTGHLGDSSSSDSVSYHVPRGNAKVWGMVMGNKFRSLKAISDPLEPFPGWADRKEVVGAGGKPLMPPPTSGLDSILDNLPMDKLRAIYAIIKAGPADSQAVG